MIDDPLLRLEKDDSDSDPENKILREFEADLMNSKVK